MPAGDTETVLESASSSSEKDGVRNNAFVPADAPVDVGKDIPQPMKSSRKLWKWRLEGMTLVVLSVIVLSAAITVALIVCVFAGPSQVQPHGAVASENNYCSRFGLELMEQDNGNAVDSAIATALCLTVVRPDVASIAGCGMMLVKNRNTQQSHLFDFMCPAPSNPPAADSNKPETLVGVPGFLKGLRLAHSQFGKRPWADLVRGALYAAENGFQVKFCHCFLNLVTLSGGIYTPPSALKDVLRTLAERGPETFYSDGTNPTSFANRLLSLMVGWQPKDLNDYKVNQPKPIQMGFAGFTLEAFPAPSSGGPFLLSLLGNTDLKNAVAPLNRKGLAENDVNATATVLHRLIEFSKAAETSVLTLGDISDSNIGIAGCGMMLVKNRNTQQSHLFDFMCPAPSNPPAADSNKPETLVGVPGFLKGLRLAHSQFGKRPWADLVRGALYAAENGFQPDIALVDAAKATVWLHCLEGIYTPPSALKDVLRTLAERGPETFYSDGTNPTSFANRLLSLMVGWQPKDLNDYKVNQPKPIQMGFAGFTLEAFPAPSSGGPFLLSLLGNTDLKNVVAPLNRKGLAENDVNATATVLHRLIEFSKAAETSVLTLGDISDSNIADEATRLQNQLFSPTNRKALVNSVNDSGTLPVGDSLQRESGVAIGDTGIVTTDSAYLTVVMNLFLGAPFGSGLIVPNTGIHLNAALRLFSNATLVNSSKPVLNTIASGRRPLVPVSPVYLSTTQRNCGIRVGVTSSGGIWGSLDSAQVVANAALFLRDSKCRRPEDANPPAAALESSGIVLGPSASNPPPRSNQYTPATEEGCINPQYATDLARFHCGTVVRLGNATSFPVYVEPNFPTDLSLRLEAVGHAMQTYTPMWPGRVALAGWNGYTMISSIDGRGSWNLQTY
ncbi:hypothetical protein AHF37_00689 [Paragonimus kellicotti]|nr:hypothetical protein AHF37_00689 [Paragonimus kellicotti]